jgi:hypothetical protein
MIRINTRLPKDAFVRIYVDMCEHRINAAMDKAVKNLIEHGVATLDASVHRLLKEFEDDDRFDLVIR